MACLLKMLSDMLQNPQPLSHIHICPKPKVKLGPTEIFHPAPPSSPDIAIATNPNQFGHTDGISVSPRWACKLSVFCINYFSLTKICTRSHRVCLTNSLFAYCQNWSHQVCVTGELWFYPNPSTSVPPSCMSVPPKSLTVTRFTESVRPS